jgi:hypothetical protein
MNNPAREARKALRAETAGRFPYRDPRLREIEPMARAVVEYGDSPEGLIIMATLERLPRDQRLDVVETLGQIDTEPGRRAFLIGSTTVLNVGQQLDLMREVRRLRGEKG